MSNNASYKQINKQVSYNLVDIEFHFIIVSRDLKKKHKRKINTLVIVFIIIVKADRRNGKFNII